MYRFVLTSCLLVFLSLFWCSDKLAAAFAFRLGPIEQVDTAMPGAAASDLPTPQLFRMAISQEGVIFGVIHPDEGFGRPEAEISLPETILPQPVQHFERQAVDPQVSLHRLSGVELLLLRDTQVVAGEASE
jgi:hypothetical protein